MREGSNARIKKMVGFFMDFYSFGMLMSSRSTEKKTTLLMLRWVMVDLICEFCDEQFNKHN